LSEQRCTLDEKEFGVCSNSPEGTAPTSMTQNEFKLSNDFAGGHQQVRCVQIL